MKKEDIQLIETYLMQKLSEAEQLAVEQRALEDADFAAEIELQTDILNGIKWHEDKLIRQKIANLDETLAKEGFFAPKHVSEPPSKISPSVSLWRWAIATGAVVATCSIIWFYFTEKSNPRPYPTQPNPNPAPTQPIAQNSPKAEPEKQEITQEIAPKSQKSLKQSPLWTTPDYANYRSENQASTLINQAVTAFQQKDYTKVQGIAAKVNASDPNYWFFQEMSGHAAYLSGRFSEATRCFERIAASNQLPFSERAEWCLLLCYFTDYEQYKTAFKQLKQKITHDTGHPYYEQAKVLK
jgi:tetratricopeptide (TPR) repeat protein